MIVIYDKSFLISLDKLDNQRIKKQLITVIEQIENAASPNEISKLVKLTGFNKYFRFIGILCGN
ncbi:MAG: hypothetical protein U1C46_07855 [Bacteroidales bacterium]|nr:hypothetical protein [Bacteroidales bacterium]MDZ4204719.1 hypothetical protein [Bacteroidales bacterium]